MLERDVPKVVKNCSCRIRLVRRLKLVQFGHQLGNHEHDWVQREPINSSVKEDARVASVRVFIQRTLAATTSPMSIVDSQ